MTLLSKTMMKKFVETKPETFLFPWVVLVLRPARIRGSSQKTSSTNRWFSRISEGNKKLCRAQHVHCWRLGQTSQYCQKRAVQWLPTQIDGTKSLKHQCETDVKLLMILGDSRFEIGTVSPLECCHDISNSSEFLTNLRLDSFEPWILDCISKGTNDDGKPQRRN